MKFNKLVMHEVHVRDLVIQIYQKEINLDILNLANYNIILSILWLKGHNPHLN